MSEYKVLSKGTYNYPQKNDFVAVKQYMIIETEGEFNGLLLRFSNSLNESVTGLKINIIEYDAEGNIIYERVEDFGGLEGLTNTSFTLGQYIEVNKDCADFKIQILKVICGDYSYTVKKNDVISVTYDKYVEDDKLNKKAIFKALYASKQHVSTRKLNFAPMLLCFAIIAVGVMTLISYLTIHYTANPTGYFIEENYKYTIMSDSEVTVSDFLGDKTLTTLTVPQEINGYKVVGIGDGAFKEYIKLEKVNAPNVESIGNNAFANCTSLTYINAPALKEIGDSAFKGCALLNTVENKSLSKVGISAFEGCSSLRMIAINGATSIGDKAFYNCSNMATSYAATNVENIGLSAFENCNGLLAISMNGTKEAKIGTGAFKNCRNLTDVTINQPYVYSNKLFDMLSGDYNVKTLSLSSYNASATNNLAALFGNTSNEVKLTTLKIASLNQLTANFASKQGKTKNTYVSTVPNLTTLEIESLGSSVVQEYALAECNNLSTLSLPIDITEVCNGGLMGIAIKSFEGKSLEKINQKAFAKCTKLESIELTDKVEILAESAFATCSQLKSIYVSSKIEALSTSVFEGCAALTTVTFNRTESNLKEINGYAFAYCDSLREIELPAKTYNIYANAFSNCTLTKVLLPNTYNWIDSVGNDFKAQAGVIVTYKAN